jgi:predicted small lipoprotein YifL
MQKGIRFGIVALAATLAACSHGGNGSLPTAQNVQKNDAVVQQKVAKESQRVTSTFVAPKHPGFIAETPTMLTWQSGIKEAGEAPVPGGMFNIVNQYSTMQNGQYVTIYAGSLHATGEGVLLVVRRSADLHVATAQTYTVAPSAVRIESATGGELQLQAVGRSTPAGSFRIPL